MKRSQAVSLVLLAGAGAAAVTLATFDVTQKEEDALIYASESDCVAGGERGSDDCHRAFETAQANFEATAPRYEDKATCEAHHGWANCRDAAGLPGAAAGAFVPVMVAVMLGRNAAQNLPVQPLYNHGPEEERQASTWSSSAGGGGYCTGSGGRVYAARSGSSAARVSSSVARTTSVAPRVIARGGFGSTGLSFASHSSGGHASASS